MLNVVMLNDVMLNVVMLNVVMPSVSAPLSTFYVGSCGRTDGDVDPAGVRPRRVRQQPRPGVNVIKLLTVVIYNFSQ